MAISYRAEVLQDSPTAYWRLGENVGATTMADDSGNGLNGTYDATNPPTLGQASLQNADANTSALFNGTTQKSSVGDNNALDLVNNFTIEAWVTLTSTSAGDHKWLGKGTVGVDGYAAGRNGANPRFTNLGVLHYDFTNVTLVTGQTYHMVYVFDSAQDVTLYLNGIKRGTVNGTTNVTPGAASLFIGTTDGLAEFWDGKVDEVAIYSKSLTNERALAHYQAGLALSGPGMPMSDQTHYMEQFKEVDMMSDLESVDPQTETWQGK